MKRFLLVIFVFFLGTGVFADYLIDENAISGDKLWDKFGVFEKRVINVTTRIINANHIDKRIPISVSRNLKYINASSHFSSKKITVGTGLMLYIQNDDELAYIIGHEISHSIDAYTSFLKPYIVFFNSIHYEYRSDLMSIDMMVKSGYNPIYAITMANKLFNEPYFEIWLLSTHPKGSKRCMKMYKYIYKKYPQYLTSDATKTSTYKY